MLNFAAPKLKIVLLWVSSFFARDNDIVLLSEVAKINGKALNFGTANIKQHSFGLGT